DTWHALTDAKGATSRFPQRGPTIKVPNLHPDRVYLVTAFDMFTGEQAWQGRGRSDRHGGLVIGLAADAPRQVLTLHSEANAPTD
nr:hypothetical protein [Planctomycetota bacterium]